MLQIAADGESLLIFSSALSHALAGASAGYLGLEAAALTGLQIKGVLFGIGNNAFAGDLAFESSNCAFDTLVIVNLYSSQTQYLQNN
jgi:hypothetical protein